jgi:ribosomal protein S1
VSPGSNERNLECRVGSQSIFNVLEIDTVHERLVLSERAIWMSQRETAKRIFIESLQEGSLVTGIVKSIRGFGAFLDIGDADGLIPISELSWHMLKSPEEVVSIGDELTVQVLKVDHESQRISLSLKRTLPEPWESVPERYSEGDIVEGTVIKLTDFGAFVRLEHWVEGLIHISELSPRKLTNPSEIVYQGQKVSVKILSIDMSKRRMSLSYRQAYGM